MAENQSTHSTGTTTHALYRFWDAGRQLLYVGISLNPGNRWKQHAHDKAWWLDVAHVTVEPHPTRRDALDAERAAITTERPLHNVVHNQRPPAVPPALDGPTPPATDPDVIARAQAQQAAHEAAREDYVDAFFGAWPRYRHNRLPQGIEASVASYHDAGLPLADMVDAVHAAVSTPGVQNRAAYFRAICRNRIEEATRG